MSTAIWPSRPTSFLLFLNELIIEQVSILQNIKPIKYLKTNRSRISADTSEEMGPASAVSTPETQPRREKRQCSKYL